MSEKARRQLAVEQIFDRWSSPIYADIDPDELRLKDSSYVGNRRHADTEHAIRLGDLALLLAEAGVALGKQGRKLPQLVAFYRVLDYDGDGWITRTDFSIAVLESKVDSNNAKDGPQLPQSPVRGGPRRVNRLEARSHMSSRMRKGREATRPKSATKRSTEKQKE